MVRRSKKSQNSTKRSGKKGDGSAGGVPSSSARKKTTTTTTSSASIVNPTILSGMWSGLLKSLKANATTASVEKQVSTFLSKWNGSALSFSAFLFGGEVMNFDKDLDKVSLSDGLGNCVIDDPDAAQGHGTKQWTDDCLLGILRGMLSSKKFEFNSIDMEGFSVWANSGFSHAVENLLWVVLLVSGKCADYVELVANLGEIYDCEPDADDDHRVEGIEVWKTIIKEIESPWCKKWLDSAPVNRVNQHSILLRAAGHLNQDEVSVELLEAVTNADDIVDGLGSMWPESKKDKEAFLKIPGLTEGCKRHIGGTDMGYKRNSNSTSVHEEMTCEELKDELAGKGLKVSGKKADLIKRLKEFESGFSDVRVATTGAAQFYVNNNEQTNDELKEECEKRGLAKSGNKKQLLMRLRNYEKGKGKGKRARDSESSSESSGYSSESSAASSSAASSSAKRHKRNSDGLAEIISELSMADLKSIMRENNVVGYTKMSRATMESIAQMISAQ